MENVQPSEINRSLAIVGFPQAGKSALKARLDLIQQDQSHAFHIRELPGVFMLGRNTPEEEKTYDYLLGRYGELQELPPDGIIGVVQAEYLERQLYLAFQLIDLRLPFILFITGVEKAVQNGVTVNVNRLAEQLGVKVFNDATGDEDLQVLLADWYTADVAKVKRQPAHWRPSQALADAYQHLDVNWIHKHLRLYTGARLVEGLRLLTVPKAVEEYEGHPAYRALEKYLDEARQMLEARNEKWTTAEVVQRSKWIGQVVNSSVTKTFIEKPAGKSRRWWDFLKGDQSSK